MKNSEIAGRVRNDRKGGFIMKSKELIIGYIGGGSRQWAWSLMGDLALEAELGGVIRLYDYDEKAAKANEVIGNRLSGNWVYRAVSSLHEAVTDADIIFISILPGTFAQMYSDVHLPERMGIFQSVGDTVGPGGIIRALRTIPPFIKFAEVIRDFAPNAWVINLTNPMSICVRALYQGFPQIKAFGYSYEIFHTLNLLVKMVNLRLGRYDVGRRDIKTNVLGLNYFTWFNQIHYQGQDLMEMYRGFVDEFYESGFAAETNNILPEYFTTLHRVQFDLFRRFGWIPAGSDRHLAEFMPGNDYLRDPAFVKSWGFNLTPVGWRMKDLADRIEKGQRMVEGEEEFVLKPSENDIMLMIKALCGLGDTISNVNLPNTTMQITNLPTETVVETNALLSKGSIKPVDAGALTDGILAFTEPHVLNQTEVLNAVVYSDGEAVYRAFGRDPLTCEYPEQKLRRLADDMIAMAREEEPNEE